MESKPKRSRKPTILRVEVIGGEPGPGADERWDRMLDMLADAFAKQILERSRAEAAAELGLADPRELDGELDVAELARAHEEELLGEIGEPRP